MKSEAMNNVKTPQQGYSENKVFSDRRLQTKMEINILGKESRRRERKKGGEKTNVSFYKYTVTETHGSK